MCFFLCNVLKTSGPNSSEDDLVKKIISSSKVVLTTTGEMIIKEIVDVISVQDLINLVSRWIENLGPIILNEVPLDGVKSLKIKALPSLKTIFLISLLMQYN